MIRILIPLDGSTAAEAALGHACAIARTFPAELNLLRVITDVENGTAVRTDSVDLALWRHQAQAYLDSLIAKHDVPGMSVRCEVAEGHPAETIVQHLKRTTPDLLVMTRYGHGNAREFAAGGTVQKIISSTDCSVLLLDPGQPIGPELSYHRILVPIDEGKDSDCAVAFATMVAEIHSASILLLQVIQQPRLPRSFPATVHVRQLVNEMEQITRQEAERRLQDLAARIPPDLEVQTRVLVSSETSLAIESTAEDFHSDLLILHKLDDGLEGGHKWGSVNQSLIQYSHRPLFILQASAGEGFASNFRSVYFDKLCREAS